MLLFLDHANFDDETKFMRGQLHERRPFDQERENRDADRHLRRLRLRGGGRISAITHKAETGAAREIDAAGRHSCRAWWMSTCT